MQDSANKQSLFLLLARCGCIVNGYITHYTCPRHQNWVDPLAVLEFLQQNNVKETAKQAE
jgi:hypothetical protein